MNAGPAHSDAENTRIPGKAPWKSGGMNPLTHSDKPTTKRHAQAGTASALALYIHVPFCRQRCAYCHFDIKVTHPKTRMEPLVERYLQALDLELAHYAERFGQRQVGSVFLGGGTPSRLDLAAMERLLDSVHRHFRMCPDPEISAEANPEDLGPGVLQGWRGAGINRVSLGVQTFHDPGLKAVRRPHDGATAFRVLANRPNFPKGCSLDLMLGLPFQNRSTIVTDLQKVADLEMEHVSVYMLERDLPTPLDKMEAGLPLPSEDDQADGYDEVSQRLQAMGYEHYEISNFAKPGFACWHNLVYWRCGDYLGLGPAAHARVGLEYWANHSQFGPYCQAIRLEGHGRERERTWSQNRLRQERLIQGLRLAAGLPRSLLTDEEWERLAPVRSEGLLEHRDEVVRLTPRGRLLANEVFLCLLPETP